MKFIVPKVRRYVLLPTATGGVGFSEPMNRLELAFITASYYDVAKTMPSLRGLVIHYETTWKSQRL